MTPAPVAVAVLGAGRIGSALVGRLIATGHDVVAHDIRPEQRPVVQRLGAQWAPTSAWAVARAEVVFTALPGSAELARFVLDDDGLVPALPAGACWIDLTSTAPDVSARCSQHAAAHGVAHLDAPIGGGVSAVTEGRATLYVGGDPATLAAVAPLLHDFAAVVHHTGDHGTGHLVKLVVNTIWFAQVGLVTEALLLGERHGVDADHFRLLLGGSAADSAFVQQHLPRLLAGDVLADFGIDRCLEELVAVEAEAVARQSPHPLTSAVVDLYRRTVARFGPVDGELLAATWLREQVGAQVTSTGRGPSS